MPLMRHTSETIDEYKSEGRMINKQLKRLCIIKNCFIYRSNVYEILERVAGGPSHKYRIMFSDDDYDYITDRNTVRRLNRFVKSLK